jgi:hypothetical protein
LSLGLGAGRRCRNLLLVSIVGAHFDIVDKVVAKVDGGWQIRRCLHDTVHQEADMVCTWKNIDCCRETTRTTLAG